MRRLAILVLFVTVLLPTFGLDSARPARAARAAAFSVTPIPIGGVALNDVGQVVGYDSNGNMAIWQAGRPLVPLAPPPTTLERPMYSLGGINNAGTVVGSIQGYRRTGNPQRPEERSQVPVIWENGTPRALATPYTRTTYALQINDAGQILGMGIAPDPNGSDFGPTDMLLWEANGASSPVGLPIPPRPSLVLNNSGQIAAVGPSGGALVGGIWQGGSFTPFPPPPGAEYYDIGVGDPINNLGHAIAQGKYYIGGVEHRLNAVWRGDGYQPLPEFYVPIDLNDRDLMIGYLPRPTPNDLDIPALVQNGLAVRLHDLLPDGWTTINIRAINNRGQILAFARQGVGTDVSVLLTPTGASLFEFGDVPASDPAYLAIGALTGLGIIRGCDVAASPPQFCPGDTTLRAQMAALIVRAMPDWPGETWPNTFTDQSGVDDELWRRVATLQHYRVAGGYPDCPAQGKVAPCYGPTDPVNRAQAISFVTRAMVKRGYWQDQPVDPALYRGGLAGTGHEQDAATYWHYTRAQGGVPDYGEAGAFPTFEAAPRGWFARLLWTAIQGTPAAP